MSAILELEMNSGVGVGAETSHCSHKRRQILHVHVNSPYLPMEYQLSVLTDVDPISPKERRK